MDKDTRTMVVTAHLSPKEVGNELSMPGFTAEASIYRTEISVGYKLMERAMHFKQSKLL